MARLVIWDAITPLGRHCNVKIEHLNSSTGNDVEGNIYVLSIDYEST